MRLLYPLSAIVGQDDLILALTICAVTPGIGGVLIRGDKGSAKSTAARALAEVMPSITRQAGCRYNCEALLPAAACDVCQELEQIISPSPVPFVNLPLGVTEERLIGTLDLDKMLTKSEKAFQPGLLAASHRGILYIDEVNLLADHLVDLLLDAAAMGVNVIEREGFSISHPAKITLIGTMNPEEGELRPQLLDRFGLMVDVKAPSDPSIRALVVRRRMSFEQDPERFCQEYEATQAQWRHRILRARELMGKVTLSDSMLLCISTICAEMGIASLRADIVMGQVARTIACLDEREHVSVSDLSSAARLVLPHRKRAKPGERCGVDESKLEDLLNQASALEEQEREEQEKEKQQREEQHKDLQKEQPQYLEQKPELKQEQRLQQDFAHGRANEIDGDNGNSMPTKTFAVAPLEHQLSVATEDRQISHSSLAGHRAQAASGRHGRLLRDKADESPSNLAVNSTLKHSLVRTGGKLQISRQDLHQRQRQTRSANLVLFAVDCSGSMAARSRIELVKGAIKELIANAYQKRDQVAVIAFAGRQAKLLLPPTQCSERAEDLIVAMETGGRTPLPSALRLVSTVVAALKEKDGEPLLVLLSDGKANVSLTEGGDAWQETLDHAGKLREQKLATIVIDTESGYIRIGRAKELADRLNGEYVNMSNISAESLSFVVKRCLRGRRG
jgi:magnesium chelatase subunit D